MSKIDIQPLTQVEPRSVSWLWQPWLPLGKAVLLDGEPGLGNSLVCLDLAARVTRGKAMPDGSPCPRRPVALLNAEDDTADTIVPRLRAAGADLDAVSILGRVQDDTDDEERLAQLPDDEQLLVDTLRPLKPGLVIIDPIVPFIGAACSLNSERHVRRVVRCLTDLAAELGACVLAVRHLNRAAGSPAIYRGSGSMGLIGGARVGLLVAAPDPASPDRILSVLKSNLAPRPPSRVFRLAATEAGLPAVDWQGPTSPDNDPVGHLGRSGREAAAESAALFLVERLAAGPVPARDLLSAAVKAGIRETTLRGAKNLVHAEHQVVVREGKRLWVWKLPEADSDRAYPGPPSQEPGRPRTWADYGLGPRPSQPR
jgi:hypothetical protein